MTYDSFPFSPRYVHDTNGKKKDDKKQFTCEICEYNTGKKYNLERHIKVHVDTDESASKTTLMCDVWGMQFLSKFGMALHTKNEHLKQFKYECQICKKGFNQLLPCFHIRDTYHRMLNTPNRN
ncbi:protein odd-skipped-related 1-like, partial [Ruditapes philippinarum]|uniref:protein odd-skipped-related 1-like n=1 Tax=Ruditapes philippinarum TaxID=129788 RepID=UPI00295B9B5B